MPRDSYTKTARIQSRTVDDVIDPGRVLAHFSDGATIVMQALHRYWPPVAAFCRQLEEALTHPVQVNVYLTPPSSRGLEVHYDTHDVFVLQTSGIKHWEVYGSAMQLPLSHQRRKGAYPDPGTPQIDVDLKPGQCLYIPRGFLHGAETASRESAHMTVGILSVTWMDVIKRLMEQASDQVFLRESLPPGFAHSPSEIAPAVQERLADFARWVGELDGAPLAEEASRSFWRGRSPLLTGQLHEILELPGLDDSSRLMRRRGSVCLVTVSGDELTLTLGDRRLQLPSYVEPAIRHILDREEFRVDELADYLDPAGRAVLVRRLVTEGLLERSVGGPAD